MLEAIDLRKRLGKREARAAMARLELRLADLQRRARDQHLPVLVVFEGWSAAGKGTLINKLILPLDPRGFEVHSIGEPNAGERRRPLLWRFWRRTPARGRMAIFDRSWYRRVLAERINDGLEPDELRQAFAEIRDFERYLADDGAVLIKFFLHIDRKEQHKRLERLAQNPAVAWRVTEADWRQQRRYPRWVRAIDQMLESTDTDYAPWTVVEAHDERFAAVKVLQTCVRALEAATRPRRAAPACRPVAEAPDPGPPGLDASVLASVDLTRTIGPRPYKRRLELLQARMRELEHTLYARRVPLVIVFEGWDAAGKGGAIRRLTSNLDPRGYRVVPVAAPNDLEKDHHWLWRFWIHVPKTGHITMFDRSWYGRVLVERVEGFCSQAEWRRAYREINSMEQHLTRFGVVLVKFWLHIDAAEQLRRFRERQRTASKRWKISSEDWRNREKWDAYRDAVDEMLVRTSTTFAPWTIVESNQKEFARIKVLETVVAAAEAGTERKGR
ncbi:MAG TPA: phosphate--AMP phosphotransferase [Myxococcota bacterium]|nr:phosphate--AMP phosphotransferase [Myxococcota bacterium]HRY94968.1 phosphate--AMP phosphotransferase [Myxococcota bacterium]HSA19969.1 phosphate--AMP phosphotransferase [Myxococcota bacterium]